MSFIDSSYFIGEINIPNVTASAVVTGLTQAITQYEKEILIMLLGYELYALLIDDLDGSGDPQTAIYTDLVDGAEFTHTINGEDITLKWEGLRNTAKQSLIAYYTYYKYVERDITHLSGSGISMSPEGKGWKRASSVNKMCAAWERMRDLYGKFPPQDRMYYKNSLTFDYITDVYDYSPSAYNFLFANKDDYPTWRFTPQWNINAFGI